MKRKQSLFFFTLFCLISFGFIQSKIFRQSSKVKLNSVSKSVHLSNALNSPLGSSPIKILGLFDLIYSNHKHSLQNRLNLLAAQINAKEFINSKFINGYKNCSIDQQDRTASSGPNIVIRGVTGSNPTIANGSTEAFGVNNTLFAQQIINIGSQTKNFRIANEAGTSNLLISDISLSGNTADFFITENFNNPIEPDNFQDFSITFQPTSDSGVRTATVTVVSNDTNENPYTFLIQGRANCPSLSGTISPNFGPVGTTISVNLTTGNLVGASVTLNEANLNVVSESLNELLVRIPAGVDVGGPLRVELSSGCTFSSTFNLVDSAISGCETDLDAMVTDLFISQITDSPVGGLTYIELYNATGNLVDFSETNYKISVFNNGNSSPSTSLILDSGIVQDRATYIISAATSNCSEPGSDGGLSDVEISGQGINFNKEGNTNLGHDYIRLSSIEAIDMFSNPEGIVDAWGVYGDETWANGLGLGGSGAIFERKISSIFPNGSYSNSDWSIININNCEEVDYSSIGTYDYSTGEAPVIISQSDDPIFDCELSQILSIQALEGFDQDSDTKELNYKWFYNQPGSNDWIEILPSNVNYSGQETNSLDILDVSLLNGYQYYCKVMEDEDNCFRLSDVIKLKVFDSFWDGSSWSNMPATDRIVVLNNDYDTSGGGSGQNIQSSFEACRLIINSDAELIISDGDYVEVKNNLTVDGTLIIEPSGSFVQIYNTAIIEGAATQAENRDKITVKKRTAPMSTHREYTYWSSPVQFETIENGLNESSSSRRYFFKAENYLDATAETANNNAAIPGQDDIDDNGDDWQQIATGSTIMKAGVGYASTHNSSGFVYPNNGFIYDFNGPLNNGVIEVPIYRNDLEMNDNNWNLIGNPYPSAIDIDAFLAQNARAGTNNSNNLNKPINGAVYLWSHDTNASASANGNEPLNYSSDDYAIINGVGEVEGGDNVKPNRFIPSGQGFFVSMNDETTPISTAGNIKSSKVVFNNSMRVKTSGSNNQFFKSPIESTANKFRLNLTADDGVFSQILVVYTDGATSAYDGMYFDAPKNLSTGASATLYSQVENSNKQFAIQTRAPQDLSIGDVISLGFQTSISESIIYSIALVEIEGDFLSTNAIYIRDKSLNKIHNLSQTNYHFTSDIGIYEGRFEIVFSDTALVMKTLKNTSDILNIIELHDGHFIFSINSGLSMERIKIFDLFGRKFYDFRVNGSSVKLNFAQLGQAAYMIKIRLSNGQNLWKKTLKRH